MKRCTRSDADDIYNQVMYVCLYIHVHVYTLYKESSAYIFFKFLYSIGVCWQEFTVLL
jgi:hypothetical protein